MAFVKKLVSGESAGYNRAYIARTDTWVATLPVGHADGWPRIAAKGAKVRINGVLYPVIASVSASHTIVEIGAEPTREALAMSLPCGIGKRDRVPRMSRLHVVRRSTTC